MRGKKKKQLDPGDGWRGRLPGNRGSRGSQLWASDVSYCTSPWAEALQSLVKESTRLQTFSPKEAPAKARFLTHQPGSSSRRDQKSVL